MFGPTGLALDELTSANLLFEQVPGRYVLHDLLRAYAAEQAGAQDSAGERRAAIRRVLDHYLLTARQAALMCLATGQPPTPPETSAGVTGVPLADLEQARAWSHAEQAVLFAVISLAASNGFTTHAWQLAWPVEVFPEQWRRWQEQVATGQIVLAAAERAGDQTGQGYITVIWDERCRPVAVTTRPAVISSGPRRWWASPETRSSWPTSSWRSPRH